MKKGSSKGFSASPPAKQKTMVPATESKTTNSPQILKKLQEASPKKQSKKNVLQAADIKKVSISSPDSPALKKKVKN